MCIYIYTIYKSIYLEPTAPHIRAHPSPSGPSSSTTRLSKGDLPVLAPEKAARAPVLRMAEPFS